MSENKNVIWTTPSLGSSGSMPLGNGDIGLNVWAEQDGDLMFYIGKTDAWDESARLLKLGRVRVTIGISAGAPAKSVNIRLWVDANRSVIRIEVDAAAPIEIAVGVELWRTL